MSGYFQNKTRQASQSRMATIKSFKVAGEAQGRKPPQAPGSIEHRFDAIWRAFDAAIRQHENIALAVALIVITAFSLAYASRQPFDVDEYLVRVTAMAGSPSAVWHILKTAPLSVDPPLFHFLTHYCLRIFGPGEFPTRLPSVVAYTFMSFVLYRFVRRYADVYTGLGVVALCLLCGAFPYAYDARPYTLVLAAGAMALLCWATLVEERPLRGLALVGLFLGMVVAVGSHWFGFLVLAPFAISEVLRTWQRRKIDYAVWTALIGSAVTALAYLPLLKAASEYRTLPWKGVELGDIPASFQLALEPCLAPLILLLVILATARFLFSAPSIKRERSPIPTPVFVCVVLLALSPFSGFLAGKLVSHAFQPRYVLFCAIGLLILISLAIRDAVARRARGMAFAVLLIGGYACFLRYHELSALPRSGDPLAFADVSVFSSQPSLPVVPGGNGLFLRIEAHAPASLRERCVFPTDPSFVRILRQNTNFLMIEALRRWTNLPITDLSSFRKSYPQFYVIQVTGSPSWLVQRLLEDHANLALQGTYDGNPVYLVDVNR
jgi:hypothetical protein